MAFEAIKIRNRQRTQEVNRRMAETSTDGLSPRDARILRRRVAGEVRRDPDVGEAIRRAQQEAKKQKTALKRRRRTSRSNHDRGAVGLEKAGVDHLLFAALEKTRQRTGENPPTEQDYQWYDDLRTIVRGNWVRSENRRQGEGQQSTLIEAFGGRSPVLIGEEGRVEEAQMSFERTTNIRTKETGYTVVVSRDGEQTFGDRDCRIEIPDAESQRFYTKPTVLDNGDLEYKGEMAEVLYNRMNNALTAVENAKTSLRN